jgi:large subunit ribosomal protein L23
MSKERWYTVIERPVITEKATYASEDGQVVFEVRRDATKRDIKEAVEGLFDVEVRAVNTLVQKGKNKRFRGIRGRRKDIKKAYVTLAEGQSLDVTMGVS